MEPVRGPISSVEQLLWRASPTGRSASGSLQSRPGPRTLSILPTGIDVTDLDLGINEDSLDDAEKRLECCALCPGYGGACADQRGAFGPGKQPFYKDGVGLIERSCDRWWLYELRESLISSNVPERYAGSSWPYFGSMEEAQSAARIGRNFWRNVVKGANPWLLVTAKDASVLAAYVAAIFLEYKRSSQGLCWYESAPRLNRRLIEYYKDQSAEDPLWRLRDYPLVAIVEFSAFHGKASLKSAVEEVLMDRYDQQLSTLLGVVGGDSDLKEAASKYPSLGSCFRGAQRVTVG